MTILNASPRLKLLIQQLEAKAGVTSYDFILENPDLFNRSMIKEANMLDDMWTQEIYKAFDKRAAKSS
jgi:hypothetical protein